MAAGKDGVATCCEGQGTCTHNCAWGRGWEAAKAQFAPKPHTVYRPCEKHKHLPVTLTAIAIAAVPVCPHCEQDAAPGVPPSFNDQKGGA